MANQTIPAIQVKDSNVGIGTVTPGAKLVVSGSAVEAHISNGDTNTLTLGNFSGGRHFIKSINLGVALTPLTLQASSFTFDTGNVGIGTTNPTSKLHVVGTGTTFANIEAGGGDYAYLQLATPSSNSGYLIKNTATANSVLDKSLYLWNGEGPIQLVPNGSVANSLTVLSSGNVGISTASPSSLLTVNGLSANTESGQIRIIKTGANEQTLHIGYNTTSDYAYLNAYKAGLGYKPISLNPDGGNVGIGTTSPVSTNLSGSLTIYKSYNGDTASVPSITAQTYYENQSSLYLFGRNSGLTIVGANGENNEIVFANASSKAYAKIGTSNGTTSAGGDMYFNTGGNAEAMRITTSGNVGINTTSPSDFLHIRTGIGWGARITYTGDNSYLRFSSNQIAAFNSSNNGTDLYFNHNAAGNILFSGTGNVGIGTTSPGKKLVVTGASNDEWIATFTNTGTNPYGVYIDTSANSSSVFSFATYTNAGTGFFVRNDGYVGIGTSTPSNKLTVNSGSTVATGRFTNSTTGLDFILGTDGVQSSYTNIVFYSDSGNAQIWKAGSTYSTQGGPASLNIYNSNGAIAFHPNSINNAMFIATSGNVGIGTTSPSERLQVYGAIRSTYQSNDFNAGGVGAIMDMIGGSKIVRIGSVTGGDTLTGSEGSMYFLIRGNPVASFDVSGNLGIGTTSPGSKLHVYSGSSGGTPYAEGITAESNSRVALNLLSGAANDSYVFFGNSSAGNAGYVGYENTANRLVLRSSDYVSLIDSTGEVVRIDGGNVGIGTTSPSEKLSVSSTVSTKISIGGGTTQNGIRWEAVSTANSFYLFNADFGTPGFGLYNVTTGATPLWIQNGGNVGIGTTSPNAKLELAGVAAPAIRLTSTSGPYSTIDSDTVGSVEISADAGNTGASSNINFKIDASNVMRIVAGGNVGIGTTSPQDKLEIKSGYLRMYDPSSSVGAGYLLQWSSDNGGSNVTYAGIDAITTSAGARTGDLRFFTSNAGGPTEKMRITGAGNVGIGTTSPDTPLSTSRGIVINSGASNDVQIRMQNNATGSTGSDGGLLSISGSQMYLWNYEASNLIFGTNNSERMRIDSSGNIGIGTTSISYRVDISGDARILSGSLGVGVAPNATDGRIDASNDIVAYSTSDQRLKENVTPIENALEKVKTLTGVEFDWKEETAHVHGYHGHDVGVIAQDVQAVLPEAVRTNDSGYLSVRYEKMIALLIEANKELAARVEELEKKLK